MMASFRNGLPKDKFSVTFDTNYKANGTVSQPIFTLNETLNRVGKIKIDRVELACSYFVFHTGNNVLGSNINGGSITITAGSYTPTTLAAALQVAIRATGGGFSAATVTYSSTTFKYTITSGSVSTFTISATSTMASLLGFNANKTTVTTATSDYAVYEGTIVLVADNRTFIINQSAADNTFTITAGNYTGITLASQLQTQILTLLANFAVTYNSNNYTFTFTHTTTAFTFKGSTSSAATALGFTGDVASSSLVVNSQQPVQIIGPTSILIKSRALTTPRQTIVRPNAIYIDTIYELSLNGNPGDIIYYDTSEESNELVMSTVGGASFSTIDFRILDDTGKIVDLGTNGRWKLYLVFETY